MHYNLLFNGCSFTWGADLEGKFDDHKHREKHRYSHVVSEKTGLSYANISRPGSSNNSILRRTVEWFEQGNTCDHAIIQWTSNVRRTHYTADEFLEFSGGNDRKPDRFRNLHLAYIELQNPSNDQYDEDMCKYWMQHFLRDKCSSFYLKLLKNKKACDSYYSIYNKCTSDIQLPYIVNGILPKDSQEYYCQPETKFGFRHRKASVIKYGGHPNELGHVRIADYILDNDNFFKNAL